MTQTPARQTLLGRLWNDKELVRFFNHRWQVMPKWARCTTVPWWFLLHQQISKTASQFHLWVGMQKQLNLITRKNPKVRSASTPPVKSATWLTFFHFKSKQCSWQPGPWMLEPRKKIKDQLRIVRGQEPCSAHQHGPEVQEKKKAAVTIPCEHLNHALNDKTI